MIEIVVLEYSNPCQLSSVIAQAASQHNKQKRCLNRSAKEQCLDMLLTDRLLPQQTFYFKPWMFFGDTLYRNHSTGNTPSSLGVEKKTCFYRKPQTILPLLGAHLRSVSSFSQQM